MALATIAKTPGAVLDYTIDWESYLGADTLDTIAWTVDGLTLDSQTDTTTTALARLSGGTAGQRNTVVCHITTASGQEDERVLEIIVQPIIIAEYLKTPAAVLDYAIEWSQYFAGDTISASSWSGASGSLVIDFDSATTTRATARISGGTAGQSYTLTNHVVMASGQEDERSIILRVRAAE